MQHQEFHDAGYGVFGLHPIVCGKCGCGEPECPAAGKHPNINGWQTIPRPWSDEQFEAMTKLGHFSAGYGIVCRGLLVVDVDARNGGVESYERLLEKCPEIAGAGLIVETGSGGGSKHLYFSVPESMSLLSKLRDYPGVDFRSGRTYVVGPGSAHLSGRKYVPVVGGPEDIDAAPDSLVALLQRPARFRSEVNGRHEDVSIYEIRDMLDHVDPDSDYETWLHVGMAIHEAMGGGGEAEWEAWSARGAKYKEGECAAKWHSFGKSTNPVTLGTLWHYAERGGWRRAVEFTGESDVHEPEIDILDTSGVDLLRPPGLVGAVKAAMDSQCRYPREHLTTGMALAVVGNVSGLKFTDDVDGVTANMFMFGVASSASGKEAVLQAATEIHREVGIGAATHGFQKSQQEIIRNHIRHQAAYYLIDELGIELKKVVNAQKRGGAVYLEGIFGALMSLYSKANGYYLISGDLKEDIRAALSKEYAQSIKKVEENEDPTGWHQRRADSAEYHLKNLDKGLDRPFLSVAGFTTPETFDSLMDYDQATSGFIGRAIIAREKESNPRPKKGFRKQPIPDVLIADLKRVYDSGSYSIHDDRIEYYGKRIEVSTTPDAKEALEQIIDWVIDYADQHKERTGLEAIVRRSYEIISKISLILAVGSGVRSIEHVRWAYAYVKADVDNKMRLVMSNDDSYGADKQMMADITKHIDKDHGETFGVLKSRLRKYKPEDVKKALDIMAKNGVAVMKQTTHPRNGKTVERWHFVG